MAHRVLVKAGNTQVVPVNRADLASMIALATNMARGTVDNPPG